mmetsp:Transcript_8356/g.20753  ORF Transcript_8356/g.20753 Transcript_8356/m.20753 type:complete len:280 (-) Transcript_8356:46-885(-)
MRRRNVHLVAPPWQHVGAHLLQVLRLLAVVKLGEELLLNFLQRRHVLRHGQAAEVDARAYVGLELALHAGRLHFDHHILAVVRCGQARPVDRADAGHPHGGFVPLGDGVRVTGGGKLRRDNGPRLAGRHLCGRSVLRQLAPLQVLLRHKVVARGQHLRVLEVKAAHAKHKVAHVAGVSGVKGVVGVIRARVGQGDTRPSREPRTSHVPVPPLHRAVRRVHWKRVVPERELARRAFVILRVGTHPRHPRGGEKRTRAGELKRSGRYHARRLARGGEVGGV